MTRSLLRSLLGGLLPLLTLSYSLSAQNDSPEQMVIYSHDQNQQVVKKTFDISQVDSIRFTVVKAPTTTFEVKDVSATASSVTLSVVPSDSKTTYYVGLDNKAHYDKTFSTDQAYLDNKLQFLRTMAKVNKKEFADYLKEILKKGPVTHTEEDLYSETAYYICVFGLDETGRVTTPLHKQTVKTTATNMTDDTTFKLLATDQTPQSLTIQVTPSNLSTAYFWGYFTKDQYAEYESDENAVADIIFNAELLKDIDWSKPESTLRGVQTITISDLKPKTEYVLLVFGISAEGKQTTKVATLHLSTTGASSAIPESPVPFGSNKDQIAAYEASEGTTLDNDLSGSQGEEYMYVYRVNKSPIIMRIYFVSEDGAGELNEYWAVLDNYDKVFQEADGKVSLTESFIASLKKSGYTAPIAGDEGAFLSSKGDQYDLSIMPSTGGDLGIKVNKIVVLDFAPRGEFIPKK